MRDLLFDVPETLSPRLAWMKKHGLTVAKSDVADSDEWVASDDDDDDPEGYAVGKTQDEALVKYARKFGIKLWNDK